MPQEPEESWEAKKTTCDVITRDWASQSYLTSRRQGREWRSDTCRRKFSTCASCHAVCPRAWHHSHPSHQRAPHLSLACTAAAPHPHRGSNWIQSRHLQDSLPPVPAQVTLLTLASKFSVSSSKAGSGLPVFLLSIPY